jgi:hypothetical protein
MIFSAMHEQSPENPSLLAFQAIRAAPAFASGYAGLGFAALVEMRLSARFPRCPL